MKNFPARDGMTLVELLVVVTILAIIAGMAVMLVGGATDKAAATVSVATQKQLTDQINSYVQLHNGLLPDRYDSLVHDGYTGTFTVLTSTISVAADPLPFMGMTSPSPGASGPQNIQRGVDPAAFSGQYRTLTVKQATASSGAVLSGDVDLLKQAGVTTLYNYSTGDLSLGRDTKAVVVTIAAGTPICIVDPQSVAGQQLYGDFGVDLSNATDYPRNGTSTGAYAWDDSMELNAAGRTNALSKQIFYVLGVGVNATIIGDRQLGLQEAPTSSVVTGGYYNKYLLVVTYGSYTNRSTSFVGVLDPKGRGPTTARQALNAIQ